MHSNFVIDIDIQEENEKAENMMNQIQKIINEYRGQPLSTDLFYTVTDKIKAKCKYFEKNDFPPMFCLMTMYGVALVDKKQEKVQLAQDSIMSSNYRITEEQIKRGSIL